jgi:hypothetical protein
MRTLFTIMFLVMIALTIIVLTGSAQQFRPKYLFRLSITVTNASYIYYYHVAEITVSKPETLTLVSVEYSGELINNAWVYVENQWGQYVAIMHVIANGKACSREQTITLEPGNYYISVLVQPNAPVHYGENATITLDFLPLNK